MSSRVVAFRIEDPQWVPELLHQLTQAFPARRGGEHEVETTWYDTFDRRLAGAGAALAAQATGPGTRLSFRAGERTVECRGIADTEPTFAAKLPAPLRDELTPIVKMRRLLPEVHVRRYCLPFDVLDQEEKTVVRLLVEVRSARAPGARNGAEWTGLPAKLVVTGLKGYDAELATLLRFLETALGLQRLWEGEEQEARVALHREPEPPVRKHRVELERGTPAPEATKEVLEAQLQVMEANEEGMRADLDTEFLHDFRIAVRRTRTVLAQVRNVFPRPLIEHYKREFRWLGSVTGPVRDIDAFELQLAEYEQPFEEDVRDGLAELWASLRNQREDERVKMLAELDSPRYANLLRNWRAFLEEERGEPRTRLRNSHRPIEEVVGKRLHRSFRNVVKAKSLVRADSSAEDLHDLRIRCKRLRYLLELFGELFRRADVVAVVKELKRLQNTLGRFHDLDVHAKMIERIADERNGEVSARALMAAGRLVAHMEAERDAERRRFEERFDRFASKENKRTFAHLLEDVTG